MLIILPNYTKISSRNKRFRHSLKRLLVERVWGVHSPAGELEPVALRAPSKPTVLNNFLHGGDTKCPLRRAIRQSRPRSRLDRPTPPGRHPPFYPQKKKKKKKKH